MKPFSISLIALSLSLSAHAQNWTDYYKIENIPSPPGVDPQYGGLTVLFDGRIAACFYSGEVEIYDPKSASWSNFARGLKCPLGLVEDKNGSLLVMQWTELTRLTDTNKDGTADHYESVFNDFGVSGNYHEFAFGPTQDKDGNLYVALNVASNFAGTYPIVRGPYSQIGLSEEILKNWTDDPNWPETKKKAGRMFSRVPYRGCVMKITPEGEGSIFAYGFRSPDGIGLDDQDRLWVTDNQGDWRGTSPLYQVTEGGFYGHPASLVWKDGWTRNPLDVPVKELESMRTRAAGLMPQGELANSPTQPIPTIDPEKFGLPKGELLIGDMNQPTLIRFLPEEIGGTMQGTMIPFMFSTGLGIGNHRFDFDEDGSLWIGKTHLTWAGDEGMRRITWNKKPIFIVDGVKLLKDGFQISFNQPLGEKLPEFSISRHTYDYHAQYGSPKIDLKDVDIVNTTLTDDRKVLKITLPKIEAQRLYTIQLKQATDAEDRPLMGDILRYNVVVPLP